MRRMNNEKKRYTETQIVRILKEVEGGRLVKGICREYEISDGTYVQVRWHGLPDVKKLKALSDEDRRLKSMFAE